MMTLEETADKRFALGCAYADESMDKLDNGDRGMVFFAEQAIEQFQLSA
jgi:hypothetical protein